MGIEVDTKAIARQINELRKELGEKCPKLSDKYDFALMVVASVFEQVEEDDKQG